MTIPTLQRAKKPETTGNSSEMTNPTQQRAQVLETNDNSEMTTQKVFIALRDV
jgi:hypothetical protein